MNQTPLSYFEKLTRPGANQTEIFHELLDLNWRPGADECVESSSVQSCQFLFLDNYFKLLVGFFTR